MQYGDQIGEYTLLEPLGKGGMSQVWLAKSAQGKNVALKIMHQSLASQNTYRERFRREGAIMEKIDNPHLVKINELGELPSGELYISMEYLAGQTLDRWLTREHATEEILDVFRQILTGVQAAHDQGIIHRDLKPQNIMIEKTGLVKITDFGVALDTSSDISLTQSGTVIGTAHYLSPEQSHGESADQRSDLYAVGVMLYQALAQRFPWEGDTLLSLAVQQAQNPALPPSKYNKQINRELDKTVLRSIAYRPEQRWQNAQDFRHALENPALTEKRRPPLWLGAIPVLLLLGGFLLLHYGPRQVPDVEGKNIIQARQILDAQDMRYKTIITKSRYPEGIVVKQDPTSGSWRWRHSVIKMWISGTTDPMRKKPRQTMPDVIGLEIEKARKILRAEKIRWTEEAVFSSKKEGIVLESTPKAGAFLEKKVLLLVAKRRDRPALPQVGDYIGMDLSSALSDIESIGLEAQITEEVSSENPGTVIRQRPSPGTRSREAVNLVVAIIPEPVLIDVPDVVGKKIGQAKRELLALDLSVAVRYRETDQAENNSVIKQNPRSGSVSPGKQIILVVARALPETTS